MTHKFLRSLTCILVFVPVLATAQTYPNKPVKLVVSFAPGGSADLVARSFSQPLSDAIGQTVIVDNRPGAGGTIGANAVAQSPADGYTLFFSATGPMAVAPGMKKSLPYDPVRSFAAISRVSVQPAIIVVNPGLGISTVAQLIALAKASPGKLNFASPGLGTTSHLGGEMFKMIAGVDMVHVPYKNGRLAVTDVIEGRINAMFDNMGTFLPYIKDGKLRALALASNKRTAVLPDLPTADEAGIAGFDYTIWFGVCAPAGTPQAIVDFLNARVLEALKDPRTKEAFARLNAEPSGTSPKQFQDFTAAEIQKWGKLIKFAGITPG